MDKLTITQPDDWHLHLRDGDKLQRTVPDAARQFKRAIIMPNLLPPVTDIEAAEAYRQRIVATIPENTEFEPLMTLYLTDKTDVELITAAAQHPNIHAVKLYPAGATTHSNAGIIDFRNLYPIFAAMEKLQLPLLIHGEVTNGDIFDREKIFLEQVLTSICHDFPELKIVLEHITTADAVDFVNAQNHFLAATITAHHLLFNRNQLLAGGIKPDYYCLPVLKRESHQQALIKAATSASPKFFLGTDSAPHSLKNKYKTCGCAGIYSAYSAIELYAQAFSMANALDKLEAFSSFYGADFYGLSRNQAKITLIQKEWQIPKSLEFANEQLIPLMAGETLTWQIQTI